MSDYPKFYTLSAIEGAAANDADLRWANRSVRLDKPIQDGERLRVKTIGGPVQTQGVMGMILGAKPPQVNYEEDGTIYVRTEESLLKLTPLEDPPPALTKGG